MKKSPIEFRYPLAFAALGGLLIAGCGGSPQKERDEESNLEVIDTAAGDRVQPARAEAITRDQEQASESLQRTTPGAAPNIRVVDRSRVIIGYATGEKQAIMTQLAEDRALIHHELDEVEAVAASVSAQGMALLQNLSAVKYVEEDAPRMAYAQTVPYGIDAVQARDVWDANRDGTVDAGAPTGSGIGVCIIDSGLYRAHEDFVGVNVLGGYPAGWDTDLCGHGTHVAGTIAAANNNVGVVGVTPGAVNLYIVKVFGDDCVWAFASDLAAAANRCATQPIKVVSMSLGGASQSAAERRAFDNLYAAGIMSIAAAGNDGNTRVSYPAGYSSVISVAAVDSTNTLATFSQRNSDVELAAPGVAVLSTLGYRDVSTLTVGSTTYTGTHVEFSARGSASGQLVNGGLCDSVGSWSGRVVVCQRGTISFYDKVHNAELGGASAVVIYNNVPGGFVGTLGEGFSSTRVAIGLSMEDGQAIVAGSIGSNGTVASQLFVPASGYEAWDGTSMATPHVSAVAALTWSANPSLSVGALRTILDNTALDLGTAGRDNSYGFGLVQALAAVNAARQGPTCSPANATCAVNADCCSNQCRNNHRCR